MLSLKRKVKLPEIMLFIVAAVVPVIVRMALVEIPPEFFALYQSDIREDLFSFHKAWVLCLCAVIIILHGISDLIINPPGTKELKQKLITLAKDPVVIMAAIYLLFVIASNLLSPYTHTALWGVFDRREGLFVQLAYITVFFATIFFVKTGGKTTVKLLFFGLLISSLIMGAIGFSQFINRDFFATYLAARLVIGPAAAGPMIPQFDMSYGTNFNPNTFGLVTAMLFPIMFAGAIMWQKPKEDESDKGFKAAAYLPVRVLFILAGALMVTGVVSSRSVGGLIGASTAIAAIVITLFVRRIVNREKRTLARNTLIICAAALAVVMSTGFALRGYIYENLSFTLGRVAAIFQPPDMSHLANFEFEQNSLSITQHGITYHINFPIVWVSPEPAGGDGPVASWPEVVTGDGLVITPDIIRDPDNPAFQSQYTYEIPGFGDVVIVHGNDVFGRNVYVYRDFFLTVEGSKLYLFDFREDKLIDPNEPIPSWGFEGWETWGSNRGYIFARTIPLLPEYWLLGQGSDTFLLVFPTHDFISNYRYFQNPWMLVDKAHNLYLQTAVTTGIISALALIAIFGYYILTTFWSLIRKPFNADFWLQLGILASVSAFSISSLSTDSTVSSTPMFWIIIGIGYAINRKESQ